MKSLAKSALQLLTCLAVFAIASGDLGARNTVDHPFPPAGAKAVLAADYNSVTVSWEPVGTVGIDSGVVDPQEVTYYIFDAFGSIFDPAIASTTSTSCVFDYTDIAGQDFVAYQITACVDDIYFSEAASTNIVAVGQPYTLPWKESFASRKQQCAWLIDQTSSPSATSKICADTDSPGSVDSDGGYLKITPKYKKDGFGIISAKIDLGSAENPMLRFAYAGTSNVLTVRVSADGGDFTEVASFDMKAAPAASWSIGEVALKDYCGCEYLQVELWYDARDKVAPLLLDAISVTDVEESGIEVVEADVQGEESVFFNLAGQRVAPGYRGIVVDLRGNRRLTR